MKSAFFKKINSLKKQLSLKIINRSKIILFDGII